MTSLQLTCPPPKKKSPPKNNKTKHRQNKPLTNTNKKTVTILFLFCCPHILRGIQIKTESICTLPPLSLYCNRQLDSASPAGGNVISGLSYTQGCSFLFPMMGWFLFWVFSNWVHSEFTASVHVFVFFKEEEQRNNAAIVSLKRTGPRGKFHKVLKSPGSGIFSKQSFCH